MGRWNNLYLLWGHFARHSRCGHDEDVEDPVDAELLKDVDPAPVGAEVLEEALQLRKLFRHALGTNSPSINVHQIPFIFKTLLSTLPEQM